MENNTSSKVNKKSNFFDWMLWWRIDKNELEKQVREYETLKITQSARGISLLMLLLSFTITLGFVLFLNWDSSGIFDAFLFLVLGFFIYKGHRWAIIGAMLLWSYEKLYMLYIQYQNASVAGSSSPSPFPSLIWWAIYMHAFYLAFQVERLRAKERKEVRLCNQSDSPNYGYLTEIEKLADLKNKGIITEEDFNKKKKQILGV